MSVQCRCTRNGKRSLFNMCFSCSSTGKLTIIITVVMPNSTVIFLILVRFLVLAISPRPIFRCASCHCGWHTRGYASAIFLYVPQTFRAFGIKKCQNPWSRINCRWASAGLWAHVQEFTVNVHNHTNSLNWRESSAVKCSVTCSRWSETHTQFSLVGSRYFYW